MKRFLSQFLGAISAAVSVLDVGRNSSVQKQVRGLSFLLSSSAMCSTICRPTESRRSFKGSSVKSVTNKVILKSDTALIRLPSSLFRKSRAGPRRGVAWRGWAKDLIWPLLERTGNVTTTWDLWVSVAVFVDDLR